MNKNNEKGKVRERNILRIIYGGVKVEGEFRRRTYKEIEKLFENPSMVQIVRKKRTMWLGYMAKMAENR